MTHLQALGAGVQLAFAYNPVFAAVSAAIAAGMAARTGRPARTAGAVLVLLGGWFLGDGVRAVAAARELTERSGALLGDSGVAPGAVALAAWALGGFVVGYALPAWAGVFVGRRVTWGTGWIAAIAVSLSTSALVAALVLGLGRA